MNKFIFRQLKIITLLSISILLFSLSFPGFFNRDGLAFVSFIALVPMFIVIFKLNYLEAPIYGFLFGMCKYLLFNYWFKEFDPAAFAVAPGIHGFYFLALFPMILFTYKRFPKFGYLPILVLWLSYEYFKSTNVVGFSYGVLAQSMYKTHLFTGIADLVGSYTISLIIIFPGLFITFQLCKGIIGLKKSTLVPLIIYITILTLSIVYTHLSKVDYSNSNTIKITLVQHNLNCWLSTSNPELYIQAYDHLESLSILGESEDSELVVWPETAFVPAIEWHKQFRPSDQRERYDLITRMEKYLSTTNALYIIGNNEALNKNRDINYNTAYLFKKDQIVDKYRKINLVPFTEQFPYPEKFPWLYNYVLELGANQMNPGEEQTLFNINGTLATILICYEDAFSELPREGVKNGSNLLVNITNDAWTTFPATPLQHLAAASLRTIETRRSLVRSGTSGFTGVIDPNGKIIAELPLFTKDQLTYDVPIYEGPITFYTNYGHIIDLLGYYLLLLVLIISIFKTIKEKLNIDKKTT